MNFSVYLDDATSAKLTKLGKRKGKNRNALIRAAIDELIACEGDAHWPNEILAFEGIPDWPAFESVRDELPAPADDPFAARIRKRATTPRTKRA